MNERNYFFMSLYIGFFFWKILLLIYFLTSFYSCSWQGVLIGVQLSQFEGPETVVSFKTVALDTFIGVQGLQVQWRLSQHALGRREGNTLERSPAYHRAYTHLDRHLWAIKSFDFSPSCLWEEPHTNRGRACTLLSDITSRIQTLLRGDSVWRRAAVLHSVKTLMGKLKKS